MPLSREEFLTPSPRRIRGVGLPDGRDVFVRSLNELEKSEFETATWNDKGGVNLTKMQTARRRLVCLCLCDQKGNRLLSDADVTALGGLDAGIVDALYDACREHVGFKQGDVEELAKNLPATAA